MHKFYDFKNQTGTNVDVYVYGEIISGSESDKWSESDVVFNDFKTALEPLSSGHSVNMYVNKWKYDFVV